RRDHLVREPGVLLEPRLVAPARMWQDKELGQVVAERAHRFSDALPSSFLEVVRLRVASDEEGQSDVRKRGAKERLPLRRALPARRQGGAGHRAGIANTARHEADPG